MEASMKLPDGLTCAECGWLQRCLGLGVTDPTKTNCDWAPSRFAFSITKAVEMKQQIQALTLENARLKAVAILPNVDPMVHTDLNLMLK